MKEDELQSLLLPLTPSSWNFFLALSGPYMLEHIYIERLLYKEAVGIVRQREHRPRLLPKLFQE